MGNIKVIVDESTTLKVCDVIEYDDAGLVVTLNAYKTEPPKADIVPLAMKYFEVWNAHDKDGIQALHAPASFLKDWDAEHQPANEAVANGINGIWTAVPKIKIEVVDVYGSVTQTGVANIKVIVD